MKKAELVSNGLIKVPNILIEYRGYQIKPKRDFGSHPYHTSNGGVIYKGYVVTDGICNVMPGATWAHSVSEAKEMIDVFIESNGDSAKFWELLRERQGLAEWEEV
jgi:hypothetical protein